MCLNQEYLESNGTTEWKTNNYRVRVKYKVTTNDNYWATQSNRATENVGFMSLFYCTNETCLSHTIFVDNENYIVYFNVKYRT